MNSKFFKFFIFFLLFLFFNNLFVLECLDIEKISEPIGNNRFEAAGGSRFVELLLLSFFCLFIPFLSDLYLKYNVMSFLKYFKKKVEISSKLYEKNDEAIYKIHLELINKLNSILNQSFWVSYNIYDFDEVKLVLNNFDRAMKDKNNNEFTKDMNIIRYNFDVVIHNVVVKKNVK